jgi:DUF971 family protein
MTSSLPPTTKYKLPTANQRINLLFFGQRTDFFFQPKVKTPQNIQLIGREVAIVWSDGAETYYPAGALRAASPSAETRGEQDIFGNQYGGGESKKYPDVGVLGWERIGNYALRFDFSDGHRTGLYTYDYLIQLAGKLSGQQTP